MPTKQTITVQHRGGLAGLIDEFRNALAGPTTSEIRTDSQGNKYVAPVQLSSSQQWMRIASQVARGAAAGYAAGKGPGGQGRAAMAGFQVGDEEAEKRRKQQQDMQAQVRQENLDKYNQAMQKMNLASKTLELKRLGATTDHEEVKFAQDMIKEEQERGSIDLGLVPDMQHLSDVSKQDPDFWKHHFQENRIVAWPEVGPNGERLGMHVFLRGTKPGEEMVPAGSEIHVYNPPVKPGDKPTITTQKTTGPMKRSDFDTQNTGAFQKLHEYTAETQKEDLTAADIEQKKQQAKLQNAQATQAIAAANKDNAEARKARIEADQLAEPAGDVDTVGQQLVDGRAAPSQLKRNKSYIAIMKKADDLSMAQTGQHYDASMGEARYKNYVNVIEGYMGDKPNSPGQSITSFDRFLGHSLEASQAVNAARNGKVPWLNTPINKIRRQAGTKDSPAFVSFQVKLDTARTEYQNFLNNNHVINEADKKRMDAIMDDNASPAQVQQALKAMANIAVIRLRSLDYGFMRATGSHVPDLISPEGAAALQHFGENPRDVYTTLTPGQRAIPTAGPNIPTGAPAGTTPPPTAGAPKIATREKIQAFADQHKVTYDQAKQAAINDGYQVKE
jgi:hypothetical protein